MVIGDTIIIYYCIRLNLERDFQQMKSTPSIEMFTSLTVYESHKSRYGIVIPSLFTINCIRLNLVRDFQQVKSTPSI